MTSAAGRALYCELDPYAQAWIRNLISRGLVCPGDVVGDIEDIRPSDLRGYNQFHAFAGIAVWSYALRRAGWPDTANVWTGSCPCQPFSAAGKGGGFADERHLWPAFHHLIAECRPAVVLGEQVASKDGLAWFDLVQSDLEGSGYAAGAVDSCSAGFGAPHIRQRLYWMAKPDHTIGRADTTRGHERDGAHAGRPQSASDAQRCGGAGELAQSDQGQWGSGRSGAVGARGPHAEFAGSGVVGQLADAVEQQHEVDRPRRVSTQEEQDSNGMRDGHGIAGCSEVGEWPGPVNGFWSPADWIFCRDGNWRPVEPGSFPLSHGLPRGMGTLSTELRGLAEVAGLDGQSLARAKAYRIGSLRGYGNAINAEQATAFCEAARELVGC